MAALSARNPALLRHAEERGKSLENRVADQITRFAGSMQFVYLHIIWFAAWIGLRVEQYPFGLLTMIVSLQAIFLSIFVLISQNRAGEKDRIRADLDYQVNLKAQHEIMQLHDKVDQLGERLEAVTSHGPNVSEDSDGAVPSMRS